MCQLVTKSERKEWTSSFLHFRLGKKVRQSQSKGERGKLEEGKGDWYLFLFWLQSGAADTFKTRVKVSGLGMRKERGMSGM